MKEFILKNKLLVLLILALAGVLAYHFLYLSKDRAASIILDYSVKTTFDTSYLRARAMAIRGKKDTFRYKGAEYSTSTGKKI